jgi:hypothetical protein
MLVFAGAPGSDAIRKAAEKKTAIDIERLRGMPVGGSA